MSKIAFSHLVSKPFPSFLKSEKRNAIQMTLLTISYKTLKNLPYCKDCSPDQLHKLSHAFFSFTAFKPRKQKKHPRKVANYSTIYQQLASFAFERQPITNSCQ